MVFLVVGGFTVIFLSTLLWATSKKADDQH